MIVESSLSVTFAHITDAKLQSLSRGWEGGGSHLLLGGTCLVLPDWPAEEVRGRSSHSGTRTQNSERRHWGLGCQTAAEGRRREGGREVPVYIGLPRVEKIAKI